ncbi:MAG: type I DNA topoisomerase [Candidatus Hydrogenedentota bacterium]|nr:MAG: type I DNA topoisomerase [Candidatus Hydrogenedentota bacterium]
MENIFREVNMAKNKKSASTKNAKKTLVIVESPTKTKSLSKFLGTKYKIESSKGHLIDLPRSTMGIDIENNFEPKYITIRGKGPTLATLRKAASQAKEVLLATDPDREGEAISWHLAKALSKNNPNIKRVEFNEITKDAVVKAIENPREIDMSRVNSQQARRLLDRLVGYSISPVLQDKFGSRRFSAGRVQSAALRILCEREEEIENFVPQEYWEFEATFEHVEKKTSAKDKSVPFALVQVDEKKPNIRSQDEALALEKQIENSEFIVTAVEVKSRKVNPPAPYITSRLQQDASTRLGFRAQKTMRIAQRLYEGIEIGKGQVVGLITYMRTDSTRISETGLQMARDYIDRNFSKEYLPEKPQIYTKGKAAQDAHEAIRPTDVNRTPKEMAKYLDADELKLYTLIWNRFVASQMKAGKDEQVKIEVETQGEVKAKFRYTASRVVFDGFRAIYPVGEKKKTYVPSFEKNDPLKLHSLTKTQKFTQPPPRFTEASLIRVMEESGIGRPATYVPTIATLDKRAYIERQGRQLKPTTIGRVVNELLVKHFPEIVDLEFTASMEEKLDKIAQGNANWKKMLRDFFTPFEKEVEKAAQTMEDQSHLIRIPIGRKCPECGHELMKKLGKNGYFIGCSNFAGGCRYSESIPLGECPLCGGNVVKKKSKKGRVFYGCDNYATNGCEFMMRDKPAERPCPKCGSIMGQKIRKTSVLLTCQNPECQFQLEEKGDDA